MELETVIISIVSLAASTIVSALVSTIIKRAVERKMDASFTAQRELLELRAEKERRERKEDVLDTMREELKPLNDKVDKMSKIIENGVEGTVTLLRESMKQTRDQFMNQGYASASDKASWHELYNTYKKLGGNHFSEYVDAWKDDVESLPRER